MLELPLVFFTVFVQTAAGMILFAAVSNLFRLSEPKSILHISFVALLLMIIGMLIASFHLGQPFRALNILFGIGRSPMSNEIISFSILTAFTALFVLLEKWQKGSLFLRQMLLILAAISGLLLVWVISVVYSMDTIVTWATKYTFIQILTTMFIVGGFATAAFGAVRVGVIAAVLGIIVSLALKPGYIIYITTLHPELAAQQCLFWLLQSLLLVLALAVVLMSKMQQKSCCHVYKLATLLVLVAELLGRVAFYNLWIIPM